jgi:ATP-dependent Zn protease
VNYNPPVTADFLRGAAFHEAGHVVVARFLGLTVGKIEIGDDGSGNTKIGSAKHLPLIDQIALCVAGIEAEALFNVPEFKHAALIDYQSVSILLEGITPDESFECRNAAYGRSLEILKKHMSEIEQLANRLIEEKHIDASVLAVEPAATNE